MSRLRTTPGRKVSWDFPCAMTIAFTSTTSQLPGNRNDDGPEQSIAGCLRRRTAYHRDPLSFSKFSERHRLQRPVPRRSKVDSPSAPAKLHAAVRNPGPRFSVLRPTLDRPRTVRLERLLTYTCVVHIFSLACYRGFLDAPLGPESDGFSRAPRSGKRRSRRHDLAR